ncbi:MAG: hypothetical protein JWN98_548 [Abditibacteriota bacterium]|nr:hypothetical protein [Abditibacteriota bacterium]
MLIVDGNDLPIGFHLDSASPAAVKLAPQTLHRVRVKSRNGQFNPRPCVLPLRLALVSRFVCWG